MLRNFNTTADYCPALTIPLLLCTITLYPHKYLALYVLISYFNIRLYIIQNTDPNIILCQITYKMFYFLFFFFRLYIIVNKMVAFCIM